MRTQPQLLRALALADRLIRVTNEMGDEASNKLARRLRYSLRPAMDIKDILALVPGATIKARAENLGVSRQTVYNWLNGGDICQTAEVVQRMAQLTGVSEEVIRAR